MKKTTLSALFLGLFMMLSASAFSQTLPITGSFAGSIPSGWVYIPNNVDYPEPNFYSTGLKMNYENMVFWSPTFNSQTDVTVTLNIGALNTNTKTGSCDSAFVITAYNSSDVEVASAIISKTAVLVGENTVSLTGTDIVKIKVIMTGFPYNGSLYCNVNLGSCTIASANASSVSTITNNNFKLYVNHSTMRISGVADGSRVDIYSVLGARVMSAVLENGTISLSDLNKGMYIVRVGKYTQKIVL